MISPHLLSITHSYSYRTYDGVLEGRPSVALMIRSTREQAIRLWGQHIPSFVIEPATKNNILPGWTHMICATGPAKSEEMHGSHLIIIWFSEFTPDTNRVLSMVDWEKHAEDFEY
jgi:hypothetical protein